MKRFQWRFVLLAIMPLLLFFSILTIHKAEGPPWLSNNYDPQYAYLLNSLSISLGEPSNIYQHPGATLLAIEAAVVRVSHLLSGSEGELGRDVLKQPEKYLFRTVMLLTFFLVVLSFFGGIMLFLSTGSLWPVIAFQASPLLSNRVVALFVQARPESLLLIAVMAMSLVVLLAWQGHPSCRNGRKVLFFALIAGFGLATKFTFLPIIVVPFFLLPGMRGKIFYLAGTVVSFMLFTLPVADNYRKMTLWVKGFMLQKKFYGPAAKTEVLNKQYLLNIVDLALLNKLFMVTLFASSIVCIFLLLHLLQRGGKKSRGVLYPLAGIACAQALQVLVVAKNPAAHYLVPSLALSGTAMALWLMQFERNSVGRLLCRAAVLSIIIFSLFTLSRQATVLARQSREHLQIYNRTVAEFERCAKVYAFRSSSPLYALFVGNNWAGRRHTDTLNDIYGKHLQDLEIHFLSMTDRQLENWNFEQTPLRKMHALNESCTLLVMRPLEIIKKSKMKRFWKKYKARTGVRFEPLNSERNEKIYLLKGPGSKNRHE